MNMTDTAARRILRLARLKVERRSLPLHRAFSDARWLLPVSFAASDKAWARVQEAEYRLGVPYRFGSNGPSGAKAVEVLNDAEVNL